ncbi:hypothetical protein BSU04_08515 [Caballeronia sordidicola]|uniref:Uncharacterized protein n=1 Tax=Caballeronia sordidicola TaxID=196367 RepID=A0A226X798_CABSO|nr:hypothetical protein BSU04_08515 [Caballeronia sordidicola]
MQEHGDRRIGLVGIQPLILETKRFPVARCGQMSQADCRGVLV